jgi:hypothetical protein
MLWYIFFGLVGLVFFKKKYNLTFWQGAWNGIVFGFVLYFGWGTIIALFSLMIGLEAIPTWVLFLYALLTFGGISILWNLKKKTRENSEYRSGEINQQKRYQEKKSYIQGEIIETSVVGVTFDGRQEFIKKLNIGEPISLIREINNPHDFNAIKVVTENGAHIGYINRELAEKIAPIMDKLDNQKEIIGEIHSIYRIKNDTSIIGVSIKFSC